MVNKKAKYEAPKISKLDKKETAMGGQAPGPFPSVACEVDSNAMGGCMSGAVAVDACETGNGIVR